jgi:hypothetical protein
MVLLPSADRITGSEGPDTRAAAGEAWAVCEITWRRRYGSASFVAVRDGDAHQEIGHSPKFRWRNGGAAPPELPEVVSSLRALERDLVSHGWEPTDTEPGDWYALRFRRPLVSLSTRLGRYGVATEESPPARAPKRGSEAVGAESTRDPQVERAEADRLAAERAEAERREAERLEAERLEAERLAAERLAAERLEAERLEAERIEAERREAERLEAERREAERLEAERREAERLAAERLEAERREAERLEAERAEGARLASMPLHDRLGAYTVTSGIEREIRAIFDPKESPRRDFRYAHRRR